VTNLWNKLTLPFQKPAAPVTPTHAFPRNPKPAEPGLWNRFTSAVTSTVKEFVTPVVNVVKKVVTPVVNTVKEVVAPLVPVWNAVKTKLSDTWNAIKTSVTDLWNTTRTKLQNGWNALQSWAHNANQAIRGFFRKHPVIAWGTTGAIIIGTAIEARNLYCYGSLLPPVSSLDLAGWVALTLAGLLTTDRKHRLHGLFVGLVLGGMIFSACAPRPGTPTPTVSICPEPPTRTPKPTQTPNPPTATPTPFLFPTDKVFTANDQRVYCKKLIFPPQRPRRLQRLNLILSFSKNRVVKIFLTCAQWPKIILLFIKLTCSVCSMCSVVSFCSGLIKFILATMWLCILALL
jgi:hypothetical protein